MTGADAGTVGYGAETPTRTLVCLTFDDALDVHLDKAIPILEGNGLRGSFYVNVGGQSFSARSTEWALAASRGHELGNHTVFHPGVSKKSWVTPGIALENYSLDRMRHELEVANQILRMLDGRSERSFAFPCSNPWLGAAGWPRRMLTRLGLDRTRVMGFIDSHGLDIGTRRVDYTPLVRELFPLARCGGIEAGELQEMPTDWHRIRGLTGDGKDLRQLEQSLDVAIKRQALAVYVFHGVGGGHALSVATDVLEKFCARLASDKRVEVVTMLQAKTALVRVDKSRGRK